MEKFWIWLCRKAYRKIKYNQKFTGIGVPALRDKEHPCEWYSPTKKKEIGECESDGHYLCKECKHFNHVEQ